MKILEISVKDSVKGSTLTALYLALIQFVSLIVAELLLIVFKVKTIPRVSASEFFGHNFREHSRTLLIFCRQINVLIIHNISKN